MRKSSPTLPAREREKEREKALSLSHFPDDSSFSFRPFLFSNRKTTQKKNHPFSRD
jgi:hypothetical protein